MVMIQIVLARQTTVSQVQSGESSKLNLLFTKSLILSPILDRLLPAYV